MRSRPPGGRCPEMMSARMSFASADAAVRKEGGAESMRDDSRASYEIQSVQGKPEYIYFYLIHIILAATQTLEIP